MKKVTEMVADWLIRCDAITASDKDLYSYAMYCFVMGLSPVVLGAVMGIAVGDVWRGVMIVLPFSVIRKFAGGFHAKSSWACLASSCLLLGMCMFLSFRIRFGMGLLAVTSCALLSLFCFSPIAHENRAMAEEGHIRYRRMTVFLTGLFLAAAVILQCLDKELYSVCISISVILTAVLQLPCVVLRNCSSYS